MVAVAAAVPPQTPAAATVAVLAAATEAAAVAAPASDKFPRGQACLNKFPCNDFPQNKK